MESSLLSLEEAASRLGYTPSGLRKIVNRTKAGAKVRTIKFCQLGRGRIKFRAEWIDEYIASGTVTPAGAPEPGNVKRPPAVSTEPRFGFDLKLFKRR